MINIVSLRQPDCTKTGLVGLFYFLWLGEHGRHAPYDISKITALHPDAGHHPDAGYWGAYGVYHHWGEPFYGYYYSDDEWVVRRHMKLILQAGIDFLFFDTTNAIIYEHNAKLVMRILQEYHDAGLAIPKVMFYTNTASGKTAQQIYEKIYKADYCPDTWFYFDGKPVIIAVPEDCSPEVRAFFTIKLSQWPNEADKNGGWPWMDFTRPQRVFANLSGEPECINVSVAQHPQLRFGDSVLYGETANCGRAYHNGSNDPAPDAYIRGYNFIEQFERAIEADVPVTLVTGWNEWIAGRWSGIPSRPLMFVDCANYEYSRDIEMMRGGYGDNYYKLLCTYTARRKGMTDTQSLPVGESVRFDGYPDGNVQRDHDGFGTHYVNRSGRHSIRALTLFNEPDCLRFVIETADAIDPADHAGTFLSVFVSHGGRQFVLSGNDGVVDKNTCTVVLRKADAGIAAGDPVSFKAADSREEIRTSEDFYDHGDVLPLGDVWFGVTV
ncbi:MAG: hypothetical protein IJC71_08460 [Clostridia bacterium]|nr:hypothetical protein [Clostridia bacterium]